MKFKDKVAIVTGAASGIGRATSILLANEGCHVALSDIDQKGLTETHELIKDAGHHSEIVLCNVTDRSEVRRLFNGVVERQGQLDIAVNNAGIGGALLFTHEYPDDLYEKVIAVNQHGVWYCMKASLDHMMKQGTGGAIVNTSSLAGVGAAPRMSAYAASKHAVVGMTKSAAAEYGKMNIRVNCVCPTVIDTPMAAGMIYDNTAVTEMMKASIPMRRFGEASEVANTIAWLCSDDSSYITGHAIRVDGGMRS